MIFGQVPDPTIAQLSVAQKLVQPAIDRAGETTWAEVLGLLMDDRAALWLAVDGEKVRAAVITKLIMSHGEPAVEIWLMGGDLETIPFISVIEETAQQMGAKRVSLTGRRGWDRVLHDRGYRVVAIELEKVL